MEDKVLQDRFIAYQTDQKVNEDEQILSSSTDLFLFYSKTLTNCARFSTRKTFLDLCKMYQKWLHEYNKVLISRLNFGDKQKLTEFDVTSICIIVNTADYCRLTSKQLENKLAEVIDKDLSTLVNFEAEIESFTQYNLLTQICCNKYSRFGENLGNYFRPTFCCNAKETLGKYPVSRRSK